MGTSCEAHTVFVRKNYKYIFWFSFDVAIINAFILHSYDVCTSEIISYDTAHMRSQVDPASVPTPHHTYHLTANVSDVFTVEMSTLLHSVASLSGSVQPAKVTHSFASQVERMEVIVSAYGTDSRYCTGLAAVSEQRAAYSQSRSYNCRIERETLG